MLSSKTCIFVASLLRAWVAGASFAVNGDRYGADERVDGETIGETTFDPAVTKKIFALAARGGQPATRYALTDPQISPLFGDFKGLPPLYLLVAGSEIFYDDTRRAAEAARAAGVQVVEDIWPEPVTGGGVFHCWVVFERFLPEAKQALTEVKAWATATLGSSKSTSPQEADVLCIDELKFEPEFEPEPGSRLLPSPIEPIMPRSTLT